MGKLKLFKYLLSFILIAIFIGTIFVYTQKHILAPNDVQQDMLDQENYNYFVKIAGFRFDSNENGENVLSIKADKFTVEKKKLGFFRLGLINDAIFENAIIDLYLKKKKSDNDKDPVLESLPSLKEVLPSFSTKNISSVVITPICLNFWVDKSLLTQITSNTAIIKLTKQNISFEGDVRVVSGEKRLFTERLDFFPESSVMKTDHHYSLKTGEKNIKGKTITLDIFLNIVNDKIVKIPDCSNKFSI